MDELQAVEILGATTSQELNYLLTKSIRAIIRQLNSLEAREQIHVILFKSKKIRRNLYCSNEVFNNLCQVKKS